MKKNLLKISLLLIAAVMLVSIAFAGAASADATNTSINSWAELEQNITNWNAVGGTGMLTIKLSNGFTNTSSSPGGYDGILVASNVTIMPASDTGEDVKLDANQNPRGRHFYVRANGNLTLCGNGNRVLNLTGGNMTGMGPQTSASGGAVFISDGGKLNLNAGAKITNCSAYNGGGVHVYENGAFTMNGGTISSCNSTDTGGSGGGGVDVYKGVFTMTSGTIDNCRSSGNAGGGVHISMNGAFTMTGGTIDNCRSSGYGGGVFVYNGVFTMTGGTITNCNAVRLGGGVYVNNNAKFIMNGGTISSCKCTDTESSGGGVYVLGLFTMTGGTITNCSTNKGNGGGVDVYGEGAIFNMTGGSIDNCSTNNGGGVYVGLSGAIFNMTGGSITDCSAKCGGGVHVAIGGVFNVNGTATIGANDVCLNRFNANYAKLITTPSFKGNIDNITLYYMGGVSPSSWIDQVVVENGAGLESKFKLSSTYLSTYHLETDGNDLKLKTGATPTPVAKIVENGTQYMSVSDAFNATDATRKTIQLLDNATLAGEITVGKEVILNLSGKTLTAAENQRLFTIGTNGNLTVMDSVGGGKLEGNGTVNGDGGAVSVKNGKFNLNGGTIANCSCGGNKGGGVYVAAGASFNMTSGTIDNCNCTIINGGGGVFVDTAGSFNMSSGTISNCSASSSSGGGVHVYENGAFMMTGGTIFNCSTNKGNGGGVYVYENGAFTMTGGTISSCNCTGTSSYGGGGVFVSNNGAFKMTGGIITNCSAYNAGGGVQVNKGVFNMTNGTITNCSTYGDEIDGGGVYVNGGTFNMSNGSITNCWSASGSGGGVSVAKGMFTMTSGTISSCRSIGNGGGVYVDTEGIFNMTGGTITNCISTLRGAGVFVSIGQSFYVSGTATIGENEVGLNCNDEKYAKIITTPSFKGSIDNIGLYHFSAVSPSSWVDHVVVENGSSVIDRFTLSTVATYSNYHLEAVDNDLKLKTGPAPTYVAKIVENGKKYATVNDAFNAVDATNKTIQLLADSTLAGEINVGLEVILNLSGKTLTAAENNRLFTVSNGGNLTVMDSAGGGKLEGNGTVFNAYGGGVNVGGMFNMIGGTIANCSTTGVVGKCGGVFVDENGAFTMSGGTITNCSSKGSSCVGGGVFVNNNGAFNMTGGNITDCWAKSEYESSGAGGGVSVASNGVFNMTGGTITGCWADSNAGVNVASDGVFNMTGGNITNCRATIYSGGGVGVASNGVFTMDGGTITNCRATRGGGVYVYPNGAFTMTGGTIFNCSAGELGGGVNVGGTFNVGDTANITGNTMGTDPGNPNNVYLSEGVVVNICAPLKTGAQVNVTTQILPTENAPVNITSVCDKNNASYFGSDNTSYFVAYNETAQTVQLNQVWHVIYDGNGYTSGTVPEDTKAYTPTDNQVTVMEPGTLAKTGHNFTGWQNATGHIFMPDATFTIAESTTLKANWTVNTYNITYIQPTSGSVEGAENATYGSPVTVTVTADSGYTFKGLTVTGNETGESVPSSDNTFTMPAFDVDVTAVFEKNSQPYTPTPSHKESGQTQIQQQAPVQDVSADPTPANQATADISVKYVGQSVLGTSTADTAALKEQYPEAAAQVELSFALAMEAGVPLTNSKGAKAVVVTSENIPNVEKVTFSRVYEISPANAGEKLTKVTVKVPKSDITSKGLTSDDVTVYHFLESYNIWVPLETLSISSDADNYYYTAATDGTSPFGVLVKKIGETTAPTTQPTQTQKSPAPFVGLIGGLGAAALLMRMRR